MRRFLKRTLVLLPVKKLRWVELKAISQSMVFDIPMRQVREDQDTDDVLPVKDSPQFP